MTRKQRIQGFLWFLVVIFGLAILFTLTFFLTGWIYSLLDLNLPGVLVQLVNSLGGLFLFGLTITIATRLFRQKMLDGEMKIYGPIIEAMGKIAKGDFSVNLENNVRSQQEGRFIGELVNSVNKMAIELSQLETMRREFVSNVSHEIQSPLTSIHGFAQALRNNGLKIEEREYYLSIIEDESMRLSRLSDNLLKLASLEAAQVKFEIKSYRLDRQIRNLVVACEPQWLSKALDLEVCLDEVTVKADEDLLSQVWLNLIHNSIKFTPQGGRISISLRCAGDKIEFKISDSGIGIGAEELAHIFDRFYKADKARSSMHGGSGLGLAISRKIVELHQGIIQVESQLGAGATFTVGLPVC